MRIFKILRPAEMEAFRMAGGFKGSVDDQRDGFIHLSYEDQVIGTLEKWFRDDPKVWLVEIDAAGLEPDHLKAEVSRSGALFPHYYATLPWTAVAGTSQIESTPDGPTLWPSAAQALAGQV